MRTIQIGDRIVGDHSPTLIIAEIGVNHDGSVERAMELVRIAADCGADAIKLQIFRADELMHGNAEFAEYQQSRVDDSDPREMLRRFELEEFELSEIVAFARSIGLISLATPFSLSDVDVIQRLGLPAIKIASPDCVNQLLLQKAMRMNVPLLISTGAATIAEVRRCVEWTSGFAVALLHCVSSYPVELDDAHLGWIGEMSREFTVPIGYSDHAGDERCGALARAAGACIIEKHLTYDCTASGPDHAASADPEMFRRYVQSIRDAERAMGVGGKRVVQVEEDVRRVSRQSLVLSKSVDGGSRLTADCLITQRPGTGISAADADLVIGRCIARDARAGTMLSWDMLETESVSADRADAA